MSEAAKPRLRVLVCGGRDFGDKAPIWAALEALSFVRGPLMVIQGGAEGADRLARDWVTHRLTKVGSGYGPAPAAMWTFPADWSAHGRAAGPIRNQAMLTEGKPDLVLAAPGGRGTADMVRRAKAAGVPVVEIGADKEDAARLALGWCERFGVEAALADAGYVREMPGGRPADGRVRDAAD